MLPVGRGAWPVQGFDKESSHLLMPAVHQRSYVTGFATIVSIASIERSLRQITQKMILNFCKLSIAIEKYSLN